jgi:class 3 adenylate cyclase
MSSRSGPPLAAIESRLRWLLPADLYAAAWVDPSPATLTRVFEHLRALQRNLQDYLPRLVIAASTAPGQAQHAWQEGTLMFTDLAGFTPLLEANMARGAEGAAALLQVLSRYFAAMIEIVSKAGGNLLEFTGDAMLAMFPADRHRSDMARAVRAGLRMQRAMAQFAQISTPRGPLALGMRVGVHSGRFLSANIGTPRRMEYVLLGEAVQRTKLAEGVGRIGRVCLTSAAHEFVRDIMTTMPALLAGGAEVRIYCQVGLAIGTAFAAEIGEPRGRREFNVLGDTVNTAARLMSRAEPNQILVTDEVRQAIERRFGCTPYGTIALKGKSAPLPLFTLDSRRPDA